MFKRSMRIVIALTTVLAAFGFVAPVGVNAQAVCLADVPAAIKWLSAFQNDDGGFTNGFAPESDFGTTADTQVAITTAGDEIGDYVKAGKTTLDYLTDQVMAGKADTAGKLGKLLLALANTGASVSEFATHNLIAETQAAIEKLADASDLYSLAYAVLGLKAVGAEVPEVAITTLLENQVAESHGWGFAKGNAADTNTTALVVQALVAAGAEFDKAAVLEYFKAAQNEDGGFPYQKPSDYGTDSDANSTAGVSQALIALGESLEDWNNPDQALATFQQANGSFTFQLAAPADSILATVQAIPVLCGNSLVSEEATAEATPAQ
ncbi:MAG: terpene cyclase/mutase family protein [Anaerolineae bacterium]|nr:terpene cyclase/mutase family protein [Anaerolineae bacterium]